MLLTGVSSLNKAAIIANAFKTRVQADSGTIEAEACLRAQIKRLQDLGLYDKASLIVTPNAYKASKIYSLKPTSGAGDLTFARASAQTRRNSAGVIENLANNVPALDYPDVVGCPWWNFPAQRTNGIRNNEAVGAVAGTPGTLPTNWFESFGGLSRQIVGVGTQEGLPYFDLRLFGTSSGTNAQIQFEANNIIAAAPSQIWTNSVFLRIMAQPNPPMAYNLRIREALNDGSFVADGQTTITPTTSLARYQQTRTNTGGTTQRVQPMILIALSIGVAYDFTIRIAAPQMEHGANASPVILTSGSALTRVIANPNTSGLTSFIGQTSGTWYTEFRTGSVILAAGDIVSLNSSTPNTISYNVTGGILRISIFPSAGVIQVVGPALVANTTYRCAIRYQSGQLLLNVNGVEYTSLSTFSFSGALSSLNYTSGTYGGERYPCLFGGNEFYPVLSNAEINALTTRP